MRSTVRVVVVSPAGEGATMIALRPLSAIIALLTGVAEGFVEGVTAPTTPTGFAYFTSPRSGHSSMTPTLFTRMRSRSVPKVLRWFFVTLSDALPSPVSSTAIRASASGVLGLVERPRERSYRLVDPGLGRVRKGIHGGAPAAHEVFDDRDRVAFDGMDPGFG